MLLISFAESLQIHPSLCMALQGLRGAEVIKEKIVFLFLFDVQE